MEHSPMQLNDLPDEILTFIFKKLHNYDVLYSLIGVNKRLDSLVNDSIFTRDLVLTTFNGLNQLPNIILNRFCLEILPKIHHKIEWLTIESSSMERVLLATDYPNLHGLGLYDLNSETAKDLFTGKYFLILCH
ncbi:unnamed protein product [Rotaria sordida]|uniref:F-box domain-containing protein n=1 Tax=Rotaria sordida TaxID=392033 RepID=A0A819DGC9_9BILA|nr:unnamed protein product [Rotaria sordida]CAF1323200.1 unnamed protein product [Rotaria sordida]CAF1341641.1 unnamed protein product [Rotaria sordida]CAF3731896.1 unnamed protein product [Rotaria sordida]CAF3835106.1 unnamed protein product [Rotaria sordida]